MIANNEEQSVSMLGIIVWLLASFFFLYEFFLRTFIGTIAPQLFTDLQLNATSFAIMGSAYYAAYALMQIPVGIITSRFGARNTLLFAIVVCAISAFVFANATHFANAMLARVLMGFGSSFAFVCLLIITTIWFPQRNFGFLVGTSQFVGTMGPMLAAGPLAWMLAKSGGDWRHLLSIIGVAGLVLASLVYLFLKEKSQSSRPNVVYLQRPEPVLVTLKKLITNPQAWLIAFYSATTYCSIAFLGAFWGTSYLHAHGLSQSSSANMISVAWLGYAISCLGLGFVSDSLRRRKPILVTCAMLGLVATALITYAPTLPTFEYAILFFCVGIAASGQSLGFAAIAESVTTITKPTALGLNNCFITSFGVIIPPISGYIINHAAQGHAPDFIASDFTLGFTIMPILYLLSSITSIFFIKETFCRPQKDTIVLQPQHSPSIDMPPKSATM